jgi:hypothetical protein
VPINDRFWRIVLKNSKIAELRKISQMSHAADSATARLCKIAAVAEPKRWNDLGADQAVGRPLAPETANPSSVARESLRRQTPKVGAVCPNWARTDLCGGREVTRVPTAKVGLEPAKGSSWRKAVVRKQSLDRPDNSILSPVRTNSIVKAMVHATQ